MERENLIKFRKKIKKTQLEMAKMLEITLSFYSKIELGLRNPSLKTLNKFKQKFPQANISDIFLN